MYIHDCITSPNFHALEVGRTVMVVMVMVVMVIWWW